MQPQDDSDSGFESKTVIWVLLADLGECEFELRTKLSERGNTLLAGHEKLVVEAYINYKL
jgi:hypothetical protein